MYKKYRKLLLILLLLFIIQYQFNTFATSFNMPAYAYNNDTTTNSKIEASETVSNSVYSIPTPTQPPATTPNNIIGDLNSDSLINSIDFALMRKYLLGMIDDFPTENDMFVADINNDNSINSIDFALLRMYLLGFISDFIPRDEWVKEYTYKSFNVILDASTIVMSNSYNTYNWNLISKPAGSLSALSNNNSKITRFVPDIAGEYLISFSCSGENSVSSKKTILVKAKNFGATIDDIDTSILGSDGKTASNMTAAYSILDIIPLCDGWIITPQPEDNKVIFLNALTGETGKEFILPGTPNRLEFDFERDVLLVSLKSMNKIARINVVDSIIDFIDLKGPVDEMVLGEKCLLFATTSYYGKRIEIIDYDSCNVLNSQKIHEYGCSEFMVYNKYSDCLLVAPKDAEQSHLLKYSFKETNYTLEKVEESDISTVFTALAISPDEKHIAIGCLGYPNIGHGILDIDSYNFNTTYGYFDAGSFPNGADFSLDGKKLLTSNEAHLFVFDVDSHTLLKSYGSSYDGYLVPFFSRGGKIVYTHLAKGLLNVTYGLKCFQSFLEQSPVQEPELSDKSIGDRSILKTTYKGFKVNFNGDKYGVYKNIAPDYKWSLLSKPEGSNSVLESVYSSTPYIIPDQVGNYQISLTINDNKVIFNLKVKDFDNKVDDIYYADILEESPLNNCLTKKIIALCDGWMIKTDKNNIIHIVNAITGEIGKEYKISSCPNYIDFDFHNGTIIASLKNENKIVKIDVENDAITYIDTPYNYSSIVYGENNIAFAINNSEDNNWLSVIDLKNQKVLSNQKVLGNMSIDNYINIELPELMLYDQNNNNLFICDKETSNPVLFRYSFDESNNSLQLEQRELLRPNYREIKNCFKFWLGRYHPLSGYFSVDNKYLLIISSQLSKIFIYDIESKELISTVPSYNTANFDRICVSRGNKIIYQVGYNYIYLHKNLLIP